MSGLVPPLPLPLYYSTPIMHNTHKFISIILLFMLTIVSAHGQRWADIKARPDIYLCGEGEGSTIDEADQQALAALVSQLSVAVSNDFSITEDERTQNGKLDAHSYTRSKLQTYSAATLTNTERIVISNDPDHTRIGRYIKRTELNRIFEGRVRTLKENIRLGIMAEKQGKIDDALRNYYWAFTLLKTVQHPADVKYTDEETGDALLPLTWLPERMHKLFSGINVKVVGNDGTNVDLDFTYNGKPVSSLDFSYFDGRDWSNLCSVKDGRGTMEFSKDMVPETVQLNYEYAYRGQAHISPEVQSVLTVVNSHTMRGARVSVRTGKQKGTSTASVSTMAGTAQSKQVQAYAPVADEARYRNVLNRVVNAIRSRQYDSVADCFTPDGAEMFKSLVQYGRARVLNTDACALYQYDDNVVARSIQMVFSFKQGVRKNFVEDVVFTFNADGKIDCLAFGLDSKARTDILGKGVWPIEARQKLMEFLENYKTAYALKRLDYLRTIFDDDAVIIVGHVATKLQREGRDAVQYKAHRYITRTHYSKEQYLRNLSQCFQSNEFVNIRFANNDVRKARTGEEYGIQIKQDYYSSSYGDVGYLYLQVDLNDRRKPVIKVRTWQPEPDPEVGLYGIGNW